MLGPAPVNAPPPLPPAPVAPATPRSFPPELEQPARPSSYVDQSYDELVASIDALVREHRSRIRRCQEGDGLGHRQSHRDSAQLPQSCGETKATEYKLVNGPLRAQNPADCATCSRIAAEPKAKQDVVDAVKNEPNRPCLACDGLGCGMCATNRQLPQRLSSRVVGAKYNVDPHEHHRTADSMVTETGFDRRQSSISSVGADEILSDASEHAYRRAKEVDDAVGSGSVPVDGNVQGLIGHIRRWAYGIVSKSSFDFFFALVILTNSIFIGVQAEFVVTGQIDDVQVLFRVAQYMYGLLFTAELVLRLAAYQRHFFCGKGKGWNWFDFIIVAFMLAEFLADWSQQGNGDGENPMRGISAVRMARMVRMLRLLRLIRIMRIFRPLRLLVFSIIGTLESLVWAIVLLFLILYIFGVAFVQACADHWDEGKQLGPHDDDLRHYFGTLPRALFTLFMSISGGLSWEVAIYPLSDINWFYVALFNSFIILVVFAVLNVITGVFCQSAIENAERDKDEVIAQQLEETSQHSKELRHLFNTIDASQSGTVTIQEFENYLADERVVAYFKTMDISSVDAFQFFKLLDDDDNNMIDIEEFVEGILRLRGHARSIDIAMMMKESKRAVRRMKKMMHTIDAKLLSMSEDHKEFSMTVLQKVEESGDEVAKVVSHRLSRGRID